MSHSGAIVRDDAADLTGRVELHELAGLRSPLIGVVEDDAVESPHDVQKLEPKLRISLEPERKIGPQRLLPGDGAGLNAEEPDDHGREQHHALGVVGHDRVELVGVPGLDPVAGQLARLLFFEHAIPLPALRRCVPAGAQQPLQYGHASGPAQRVAGREFRDRGTRGGRYGLTEWGGPRMRLNWWIGSGGATPEPSRSW